MIDTRRAHQMTKMAMFEREESDNIRIVKNHTRKGYIFFWTMIYSVASILVYLLYILIGISIMIAIFENRVPSIAWIIFAVVFTSGFVFHTYYLVKAGRKKAAKRYDESDKKNEFMTEQYRILDDLYKTSESSRKIYE